VYNFGGGTSSFHAAFFFPTLLFPVIGMLLQAVRGGFR
jgi:hypothetical protein